MTSSSAVQNSQWIDEQRYLHALNFCMLLPGPEAMQLATYVGWRLHGLKGGLTALSSLALASDTGAGRTRVPLTQSPYYKALVKGEALPSKAGRADDFSWPKPWLRPSG